MWEQFTDASKSTFIKTDILSERDVRGVLILLYLHDFYSRLTCPAVSPVWGFMKPVGWEGRDHSDSLPNRNLILT